MELYCNLNFRFLLVFLIFQVVVETVGSCNNEVNCSRNGTEVEQNVTTVLSRRKRFLLFPDGSSFQLVFCVQNSALIRIGDIFLYGNTASLAWPLPSDPSFLTMFKKYEENAQSRGDSMKHKFYSFGEKGEVLSKVPKRKPIINPVFVKRSVRPPSRQPKRPHIKIDKKRRHEKHLRREFLKTEHMDESSIRFHRNSRLGLFGKLEKLFKALGHDGRQCVLKKLCYAAQIPKRQQKFLQEILHVIFTLPKGKKDSVKEEHKEYDRAHKLNVNCSTLYPDCDEINFNNIIKLI